MKQAILITAYKNFAHLEKIIECYDDGFNIYIHIDRKTKIPGGFSMQFSKRSNIQLFVQKYQVNWGGFNHLKAILFLSRKAVQDKENYFFHLISGQDYPIKGKDEFRAFFKSHREYQFLEYFDLPYTHWTDNGGMDRIEFYNLYDVLNAKVPFQNSIIRKLIAFQKCIGIKRSVSRKIPTLFGGSTWWSLNRECITYVLEFSAKNKFLLNRLKHTLCSEEFYFPTVIMNSRFSANVTNDNLRIIDWNYRNGNNPAVLDETDFERLKNSGSFFARKFEPHVSQELIEKIKQEIHV